MTKYSVLYKENQKDSRSVFLAGKSWDIPQLPAKTNKVIDPLILRLLPVFSGHDSDSAEALAKLDETHYALLLEIAFQAMNAYENLVPREEFLNWPITLRELVAAFPVVAQQTGIFVKTESAGAETQGEA